MDSGPAIEMAYAEIGPVVSGGTGRTFDATVVAPGMVRVVGRCAGLHRNGLAPLKYLDAPSLHRVLDCRGILWYLNVYSN